MMKIAYIMAAVVLVTACGKQGDSIQNPPVRFVGTWGAIGTEPAQNATDVKLSEPVVSPYEDNDPCNEYGLNKNSVNAGIMRVDGNGNVWSAKNVSSLSSQYTRIGKIKQDGLFIPLRGTEKEYLNGGLKLGTLTTSPLVYFVVNKAHSQNLGMQIKFISNSASGLYISGVMETRHFVKINSNQEKAAIEKALECLAVGKPN